MASSTSVDLTTEAVPPQVQQVGTLLGPQDPRERTRSWIAFILLGVLVAVVGASIVVLFDTSIQLQRAKDMISLILTPTVGLVGSVVGFYFGAQTAQAAQAQTAQTQVAQAQAAKTMASTEASFPGQTTGGSAPTVGGSGPAT
jgi:hypothetical protein